MGIFDGILLATDWDGTLFYDGEINQKNIDAINYFCDNGGKFTVCSGRCIEYLKERFIEFKPNTYVITLNGAVIIHPETNELLHEGLIESDVTPIIDSLLIGNGLFNTFYIYKPNINEALYYEKATYTNIKEELSRGKIYKAVLVTDSPEKVDKAKSLLPTLSINNELSLVSSWDVSLEILKEGSTKGYGIRRVAEKEGIRLTVAVGDFENDIQMIKMANIGYAVENATPEVKAAADRITAHAKDGALYSVISDLEKNIRSGNLKI